MRSVTETFEEGRSSVEVTINAKGEISSVVKLYFDENCDDPIAQAVDMNLHARDHYFNRRNGIVPGEETK